MKVRDLTDLTLRATKQTAAAIRQGAVATEQHLWLNLADIGSKEKNFLLNALLSPFRLFDISVEMVVEVQ